MISCDSYSSQYSSHQSFCNQHKAMSNAGSLPALNNGCWWVTANRTDQWGGSLNKHRVWLQGRMPWRIRSNYQYFRSSFRQVITNNEKVNNSPEIFLRYHLGMFYVPRSARKHLTRASTHNNSLWERSKVWKCPLCFTIQSRMTFNTLQINYKFF